MSWFEMWWRKFLFNCIVQVITKATVDEADVRELVGKLEKALTDATKGTELLSILGEVFTKGLKVTETDLIAKAAKQSGGGLAPVVTMGLSELVGKGNSELAAKLSKADYAALMNSGGEELLVGVAMEKSDELKALVVEAVRRLLDVPAT